MDTLARDATSARPSLETGNRLIDSLPLAARSKLLGTLEPVELSVGQVLFEQGTETAHAIFPVSGVASLLAVTSDGDSVEVATIGNEGMIGLHLFLGARSTWVSWAVKQIAREGFSMPAETFHEESRRDGAFREVLLLYTQALFAQVSQGVACNRLHPLEQRCARWLLMCRDRAGSDEFSLTHEFLADMLGVRRPSVTIALGILQEAGLISTRRRHIEIRDGERLEAASCGCYAVSALSTSGRSPRPQ